MPAVLRAFLAIAFVLTSACSQAGTTASSAARVTGTPLAQASGLLDAEVAMPPNFPTDVPIYPKARLTAGASFASSGQVSWGMEWETPDAITKVLAFYERQFAQGDWMITIGSGTSTTFTSTVARKSNPHFTGTLGADSSSGVTKILLSLVSSG